MTTPRKLYKKRQARRRQREQMKNLQRGQQEAAAPQQGAAPSANPKDPQSLIMGGSADIRVVPKSEMAKRGVGGKPQVVGRGQKVGQVRVVSRRTNKSSTTVVRSQRDGAGNRVAYGNATIIKQQPHRAQQGGEVPQNLAPPVPNAPMPTMARQDVPEIDLTVILTCFERPALLRRQLQALQAQTVRPRIIMAWVNSGEVPHDERALNGSKLTVLRSNANLGPWIRFTVATEAVTKYVCILDDDTLPGPRWLEACFDRLEEAEANPEEDTCCIAAVGAVFRTDHALDSYLVGPRSPRDEELEVDMGRQGWFFRRDLANIFVNYPRQQGPVGWDLHFAAALQNAGIFTICLPYDTNNSEAWGSLEPPVADRSLTSKINAGAATGGPDMNYIRTEIYNAYRHLGWQPLVVLDQEADEADEEDEASAPAPEQAAAPSGT